MASATPRRYSPVPLHDRDDIMASRASILSPHISPNGQFVFAEAKSPDPSRSTFRSSVGLIPTPGTVDKRPPRYEPLTLRLWVVLLGGLLLICVGVGLEVALSFSQRNSGFHVPEKNIFTFASTQFLTSFFPTLVMIPLAYLAQTFDWQIRAWQPYVALSRGHARAEQSILLDYINMNRFVVMFSAFKFRHKLIIFSTFTAFGSYILQPLAGSIFSVQQKMHSSPSIVKSTRTIGLSAEAQDLNAFASSAGYALSAVFNTLVDPPFVLDRWSIAEFDFPLNQYLNGSMSLNTTAVQTNPGCSNPLNVNLDTTNPATFVLSAESVDGCVLGSTNINTTAADDQYGVFSVPNCGNVPANASVDVLPIFFWFWQKDGVAGVTGTGPKARGVFCTPTIQLFDVTANASLNNGSLTDVVKIDTYPKANNVTGGPQNGLAFNGVLFDTTGQDSNVNARAVTIKSAIPNAIFKRASLSDSGLQSAFDDSDGFLAHTEAVYTQHLALAATSTYFVSSEQEEGSVLTQLVTRLVIQRIPAHLLSIATILIGLTIIIVHILHHRSRRLVYLPHQPGSIATAVSQTAHSGFGQLLMPYDDETRIAKKLEGLMFRLDRRTGAIVVDDAAVFHGGSGRDARDESMMALVGKRGMGRMESVSEEGKLEGEEGSASASGSGSGSRTPLTRGAEMSP